MLFYIIGVGVHDKTKKMTSLGDPSILTQGTEYKSHSTLHRVSFADTASVATVVAALPHSHKHSQQLATPASETAATPTRGGLLTMRKMELNKKYTSKSQYNQSTKT